MSHPKYPNLFSPIKLGPVTARNRVLQTAHVKLFTRDGHDSLRNVAYQVERARNRALAKESLGLLKAKPRRSTQAAPE